MSHEQKLWYKNCIKDLCEEKVAAAGLQFYNFTTLFSWSSFSSIFIDQSEFGYKLIDKNRFIDQMRANTF